MRNTIFIKKIHIHFSDAIRMILLHRFGGWYSDMKFVFLRPLKSVLREETQRNAMVSAEPNIYNDGNLVRNFVNVLTNELFRIEAGHIFLEAAMGVFKSTLLDGEYTSRGAMLFTKALNEICSERDEMQTQFNHIGYDEVNCSSITILDPSLFYPLDSINARLIQSHDYWYNLFKNSVAVHFSERLKYFGSLKENRQGKVNPHKQKVLWPNNYGKNKPPMTFIGSQECPLSFFSTTPF